VIRGSGKPKAPSTLSGSETTGQSGGPEFYPIGRSSCNHQLSTIASLRSYIGEKKVSLCKLDCWAGLFEGTNCVEGHVLPQLLKTLRAAGDFRLSNLSETALHSYGCRHGKLAEIGIAASYGCVL